ncbi:hypothetical protein SUSAZ_00580 [Sulfolobus acidocaldarius SUSAZ]|nr:hypothetical protein SUSAZ_00580 [Sulfolobus acidocaldarius SUSAZ]
MSISRNDLLFIVLEIKHKMESQLTLITLTLVIATIFGVALSRFRISPIPAYLIAGLLGKSFGLDYGSDLFNFLSTLAINLVSFNVGISLDIRELKNILSKATIIAITEYIVGFTIISIISLIIGLPFYDTFILTIISVTTSTTIT